MNHIVFVHNIADKLPLVDSLDNLLYFSLFSTRL